MELDLNRTGNWLSPLQTGWGIDKSFRALGRNNIQLSFVRQAVNDVGLTAAAIRCR